MQDILADGTHTNNDLALKLADIVDGVFGVGDQIDEDLEQFMAVRIEDHGGIKIAYDLDMMAQEPCVIDLRASSTSSPRRTLVMMPETRARDCCMETISRI